MSLKRCKGVGKAEGFGCGKQVKRFKYGMCQSCFFTFLYKSPEGLLIVNKTISRAKIKVVKEKKQLNRKEKEEIKTLDKLFAELQDIINPIIRMIDVDKGCISCDHGWNERPTRQFHSGHFFAKGFNTSIRFNTFNIYKQCSICNNILSANPLEYRKGILRIYGMNNIIILDGLRLKYKDLKFTKTDIREAKIIAAQIRRNIKKGKTYTRIEVNQLLKLYP